MGLGLSISRQTISAHGGRLTVESELGHGTVFRVVLPVDGSAAPRHSLATPIASTALSRGRILVIDDEPLIGRVIEGALNMEHDVVVVQRAAEGLARLEVGATFDLVLCDLVMPDMSGPEFYAKLVERWPLLTSQVVFMTGGAFTPGTVEFVRKLPINRVVAKPFALDEIRELVRDHLRDATGR